MRVFVAGATGAIGAWLVPQLVERGHEVVGTTRTTQKAERLRAQGAEPVVLDLLDARAVREAVVAARPNAIVHQGTALAGLTDIKHFDRSFRETNRLRTEGTDTLLDAGREVGVSRFVAQSYAGWPSAGGGNPVKTEDDPLDPAPVPPMRETVAAIRHLEEVVVEAGGLALRYGGFYGSSEDVQVELVRKRRLPIVGDGGGVMSFVHLEDAAAATVLALERGAPGVQHRRRRARSRSRVASRARSSPRS
jgi:2-alkyl-3-oxoalkanoate reductase